MRTKKARALEIKRILDGLFPDPIIPLNHFDSFTLLIAVLLSAQSTDKRVNIVTKDLFALAKTPEAMSRCSIEDVEKIIRPCGLGNTKARAIIALSQILVERFSGVVPCDINELEKLPGVGHKTASVVMIQAFGVPAFPVDTHIHRCAKRWGLSPAKTVKETENDLKKLFSPSSWAKLHLQIIYFARKYCPARAHIRQCCPICSWASKDKDV
jgi:endonuclease-3